MFAVFAGGFDGSVFSATGFNLNETWDNLLAENDLVDDDIDFETVEWFAKVDGVELETVTRWVSNEFDQE